MEENNNQQVNDQNDSNNTNHSQGEYREIEENKSSSKYNLLIFIFNIDFGNISSNNDSAPFHEFENISFNFSKIQKEIGEIKKELS